MRALARAAGIAAVELVAIVREAILIVARLWMRAAEIAGAATLAVWGLIRPILAWCLHALVSALRFARRVITPARTVSVVALCATTLLVASQYVDYRGVEIGASEYSAVSEIAAAPQQEKRTPADEHGLLLVGVGVASLVVIGLAARGRWRLARLLVPLGAVVVVVSLAGDAPAGLDEGAAELAYEGAHAVLLPGFWVQLSAGAVMALCGLLLPGYARSERAPAKPRRRRSGGLSGAAGSPVEGART